MIGRIGTSQIETAAARRRSAPVRALVPVAARPDSVRDAGTPAHDRPATADRVAAHQASAHRAAFVAHLLATRDAAPQTRQRRRAEPAEAVVAYRAARLAVSAAAPVARRAILA